jgi:hypothetical protein
MPKPAAPQQFKFCARGGTLTLFTRQPTTYDIIEAPTFKRGDGGQVKDGLDKLKLMWTTLLPAEWDQLMGFWNAAINAAGLAEVNYWDELGSSGAGAYVEANCTLGERPKGRRGGPPSSPNYHDVEWVLDDLEIAD